MSFTTISTKRVICPLWNEEISLRGKYLLSEEAGHQYEAKLLFVTCPIVENLRRPISKRNKDFDLFRYCDLNPCEAMNDFKSIIDTRKHHSQ